MDLESFPDELFSLIFSYLHKIDLFWTFYHLNQRFQQIIEPCFYDIDLSQRGRPFYRVFFSFLNQLLPLHGQKIHVLQIVGHQQVKLFLPHLHQLINLKSLRIKMKEEYDFRHDDILNRFVTEALTIQSLTELSILTSVETADDEILKTIALRVSPNLTTLVLIYHCHLPSIVLDNYKIPQMSNITRVSINLCAVNQLRKLFKIMPNLQELNLSMIEFYNLEYLEYLKVPQTLEHLHLEFGGYSNRTSQPNLETIHTFLLVFKDQLRSLTLIAINANKDFSNLDKLQSLVENFTCLETYNYRIRTVHQPHSPSLNAKRLSDSSYSISSRPKLRQFDFDTSSKRRALESCLGPYLTLQQLFNCETYYISKEFVSIAFELDDNLKLVNLKTIKLHGRIKRVPAKVYRHISQVLAQSPNLSALESIGGLPKTLIEHLFEIILPVKQSAKKIHYLYLDTWYSSEQYSPQTFFSQLSLILPNLKTLKIKVRPEFLFEQNCYTSLSKFIQDLRSYFWQLSHLILLVLTDDDDQYPNTLLRYTEDLDQLISQQQMNNTSLLYYTAGTVISSNNKCLDIWL